MKVIIHLLITFLVSINVVFGSDTILISMQSKPFFYNVIISEQNEIYAGTSDGIYQIRGTRLQKKSDEKGYVTFDAHGKIIINDQGIKNYEERRLLYLLPYPEWGREEYHAETKDNLYIVSNGTLYIFEFTPFSISYPYMSIRTISKNWVGGYSGVYYKGRKIPFPGFCDGYIREFNQKAFVCYSSLLVLDMKTSAEDSSQVLKPVECLKQLPKHYIFDVFYSEFDQYYYLASDGKLIQMDKEMTQAKVIYQFKGKEVNILGTARNSLFFTADSLFLNRNFDKLRIDTIAILGENIKGGYLSKKNYYLLTPNSLYVHYSDGTTKKLTALNRAHTLLASSPSELLIGTDNGLFHFNTANNSLSTVIEGVEFNNRGLYLDQNKVYAGSIVGLYSFFVSDINQMIERNKEESIFKEEASGSLIIILIILCIIILLLVRRLYIARNKLQQNEVEPEKATTPQLTREIIENYIRQNLATASINSINDHFDTNSTYVYSLFEPEKPGSTIQQLRLKLVADMKKSGAKVSEISEATGLSASYIRKLKVDKESM